MGFNIHNAPLQEAAFIVAVVGVALSIGALVLRFVATRHASRKPGWEDWFAVLAVFFHIAYVVPFLYSKYPPISPTFLRLASVMGMNYADRVALLQS